MNASFWTPEQDGELRRLWGDGMPTSAIARALGVTKNSVIGRAHRLQLEARPRAIKTERAAIPPRRIDPADGCRFPMWPGHSRPTHKYCNGERKRGADGEPCSPYCESHHAKTHVGLPQLSPAKAKDKDGRLYA